MDNDRKGKSDVFVYDRTTKMIERVSLTEDGDEGSQHSRSPSISGDGRYVAFESSANNLIDGYRNGNNNVYVYDRQEKSLVGVSVPYTTSGANRSSQNPSISSDGNFVAFEFHVSKNDGNRSFKYNDIYLYHRETRAVERVTGSKVGIDANKSESEAPAISADGRFVAFQSNLEDLDFNDTNDRMDIFVYDRVDGRIQGVSSSIDGVDQRFEESVNPAISGNGRYIAFQSRIANFVPSDTNGKIDVFVRDLVTGKMALRSSSPDSVQGDGDSTLPSLSFDGSRLAFSSRATNLGTADTNTTTDIYVFSTKEPTPRALTELESLTSSLGAFSPSFSPDVLSYNVSAPAEVDALQIRPVAVDNAGTIEVQVNAGGFGPMDSNAMSEVLPISVGENTVDVLVTSADGTAERRYVLNVNRQRSSDATLAVLALFSADSVPVTPDFSADTLAYSAVVSNETTSVALSPTAAHPLATITINGSAVAVGDASDPIALNIGDNTITTTVIAEGGASQQTYTTTVTRLASSNASLASLVSGVEPTFGDLSVQSDQLEYTMSVSAATTSLKLTPTLADNTAKVAVNGQTVASGAASQAAALEVGENLIVVSVTAEDGSENAYLLTVTRPAVDLSSNTDLASLTTSAGVLDPVFDAGVETYAVSVPDTVTSLTVTPTAADSKATIQLGEEPVPSGVASSAIPLEAGVNIVSVTVIAEDQSVKGYYLIVTRAGSTSAESDAFRITHITNLSDPSTLRISWNSEAGTTYALQQSADLIQWETIGDDQVAGEGNTSTIQFERPGPVNERFFLRVIRK